MSKHTPGPWEFSKTAHGEAGISILHTDRSSSSEWVKWEMARVGLNSRQITPEAEANARLIAAAPELLEAANRLVTGYWAGDADKLVAALEKIIAKAEGK